MNRTDIISELTAAPGRIAEAQATLHAGKVELADRQDAYHDAEARLLLETDADGNPRISGRNAEARAAQLREALAGYHSAIRETEEFLLAAVWDYEREVNRFRAARSIAMLLAGDVEEVRLAA